MVPISWYLALAAVLFCIGMLGLLLRRNAIVIFMCIELMLNSVNLSFVAFSQSVGNLTGQIAVVFVMVVAAAEAAIGLAIVIALFRCRSTLDTSQAADLKY